MNEFLLVLILLADPNARPAADSVAQRITDQAGSQVHVLIGAEALAELKKHDVTASDIANQPAIGMALTSHDRKLAVVRIDRDERGGNIVIESVVWALGHRESHVAISGASRHAAPPTKPIVDGQAPAAPPAAGPAEPLDSVQRGVLAILGPWLGTAGATPAAEIENRLAGLADSGDWKQIINLTDTLPTPSPRQRYYRILALVRSERLAEAEADYQLFRTAQPNHVLLSALDSLLHPNVKPVGPAGPDINNDPAVDDGANVLH